MKVYASDNIDSPLLNYVGKDAWIRCVGGSNWYSDVYVRVVSHRSGEHYILNVIHVSEVDELQDVEDEDVLNAINEMYNYALSYFTPATPLTVWTTAQLFPNLEDPASKLFKYVGKNVWVKVYGHQEQQEYYINILSRQDNLFTCKCIEAVTVDGEDDYYEDYDWGSLMSDLKKPQEFPVDAFSLITPVEAYTTDEIISMIRAAWEAAGGFEE